MVEHGLRQLVLDYLQRAYPSAVRDVDVLCAVDLSEIELDHLFQDLVEEGLAEFAGYGYFSCDWRLAHPLKLLAAQAEENNAPEA